MAHRKSYHIFNSERCRSGRTFASVLLMMMLFLPVEYFASIFCPMEVQAGTGMTGDCCQNAHENPDGEHAEKHNTKDESAEHHCPSFAVCDCHIKPDTRLPEASFGDGIIKHLQADLPSPVSTGFITFIQVAEEPEITHKPAFKPIPLYLKNQVFLN
ncbi:MAG: hypothetical protein WD097_09815 [Balneolales bacterium]